MISRTTKRFRDTLAELPVQVQQQARQAYQVFSQNPHHPRLRFKKVHTSLPVYSARVNIDYRAVGAVDGDEILWFWIGSHAGYEKLLKRL